MAKTKTKKRKPKAALPAVVNGNGVQAYQQSRPPLGVVSSTGSYFGSFVFGAGRFIPTPYNPDDLVKKKGIKIYRSMMADEQVKAALSAKKFAVLSTGWEVHLPDTDEASDTTLTEYKDFVEFNFNEMKGSFDSKILDIMTGLAFGFSVSEKVWWSIDYGPFEGLWGLKDLKTRPPDEIQFEMDTAGDLTPMGVWQNNNKMPADKFAIYCLHGDTRIHTTHGDLPIRELVGLRPWLFSWGENKLQLSRANRIWQSGESADCVKVTYRWLKGRKRRKTAKRRRNVQYEYASIICTPNHRFMMFDGSYKEAHALTAGDSLRPFDHRWVWQEYNKAMIWPDHYIHHKDHDKFNDDPENLMAVSSPDHARDHSALSWAMTDEEKQQRNENSRKRLRELWQDPEWREETSARMRHSHSNRDELIARNKSEQTRQHNSAKHAEWWQQADRQYMSAQMIEGWKRDGAKEGQSASLKEAWKQRRVNYPPLRDPKTGRFLSRKELNHEVVSVEYWGKADVYDIEVPDFHNFAANNVIVHNSHSGSFGNYYGESDLRAVYRPFWIKDNLMRLMPIGVERFTEPSLIASFDGVMDESVRAELVTFLKNLQSRSGIALPKTVEIKALEVGKDIGAQYKLVLDYCDQLIRMGILMPSLMGMSSEQQVGSLARSQTEFDVFLMIINQLRRELQTVINEQIVKPMLDFNYEIEHGQYPCFKFKEVTEESKQNQYQLFLMGLTAGALTKGPEDENALRDLINMQPLPQEITDQQEEIEQAKMDNELEMAKAGGPLAMLGPNGNGAPVPPNGNGNQPPSKAPPAKPGAENYAVFSEEQEAELIEYVRALRAD